MTTNIMLENITEAFAAQGYTGSDLMEKVFAAGLVMAVAFDQKEAAAHFRSRLQELEQSSK